MRNNNEKFPENFAHYPNLSTAFADGKLSLLNGNGNAPLFIEVTGGALKVLKTNGDEETTRSYSDWGTLWCGVKEIIEDGTTATAIQVFW